MRPFLRALRPCRGALVAIGIVALGAPALAEQVAVTPRLKTGDTFSIEITRVIESTSQPQQNSRNVSSAQIRIVSTGPEGTVLEWAPDADQNLEAHAAIDPVVRAASDATRDLRLRLRLDADGAYAGLANEEEVTAKLKIGLDLVVKDLLAKAPEEQRAKLETALGQVFTPTVMIAVFTRDVQTYFSMNGASLAPGESMTVDLEQPNPFGGNPLPAKLLITMESAVPETAILATTTTYDGNALLRMTRDVLAKSGERLSDAEFEKIPPMQMADDGRFVFDRTFGLMRELTVNRRIVMGKEQRLEGLQIRLVRGPQR